ncbi:MAG: SIS domain-containing protein [Chloroflexi bacterium]|nr:SIS domain-containing protein [Chloroflexota bacterium]
MQNIEAFTWEYLDKLEKTAQALHGEMQDLAAIAAVLWSAYEGKHTIYVFGNGGSAATAAHFATDVGKGTLGRRGDLPVKGFKVIALGDNPALVTAWANDAGYDTVFASQLARLIEPEDVAIAISASGNSPNILKAVAKARQAGAITVALTGFGGGRLASECDYAIVVDSYDYEIVEDMHSCLAHILAQHLRERLFALTRAFAAEQVIAGHSATPIPIRTRVYGNGSAGHKSPTGADLLKNRQSKLDRSTGG